MKTILNGLIILLSLSASAQEWSGYKDVVVGVNSAFIPSGFDSETDAYVAASGHYPNTCYSFKESLVTHVSDFVHEVQMVARVKQSVCMMMLVPYTIEVNLGQLASGKHRVSFLAGDGTQFDKFFDIE